MASYLQKVTNFTYPSTFGDLVGGEAIRMYQDLWRQKAVLLRLLCGIVCMMLRLADR